MASLFKIKKLKIFKHFTTPRYLDDFLNIDNPYFGGMVGRIYPPELQLNKAYASDTEAPFLSVSNGFVSSKGYDKRDDFDFPFLDGDVPRSTAYGVTFLKVFDLLECLVM